MAKLTKAPKTPEQIQAEVLASEMEDLLKNRFIPKEPTYTFEPGEEVAYGAFKKTIIIEAGEGNLYYKVSLENESNKEQALTQGVRQRWIAWNDLRKKYPIPAEIFRRDNRLDVNFMQQSISSLFNYVYYAGVDMNPEYQRELVWTLKDKQLLIESIMEFCDIGKFVFIRRPFETRSKELYEILDGKQRLSALCEFYEDRFTFRGKTFSQLHGYDKAHINIYPVSVTQIHEPTFEEKIELFLRLNTTGKVVDKEHLEKVKAMLQTHQNS